MTADVKLLADELESIATEELKDYPGAARIVRNAAKLLTRQGEALRTLQPEAAVYLKRSQQEQQSREDHDL